MDQTLRIYTITDVGGNRRLEVVAASFTDATAAFHRVYGETEIEAVTSSPEVPILTPAAVLWFVQRTDRDALANIGFIEPDIEKQAAAASLVRLREAAPPPIKPHEAAIRRADAYNAVHSGVYSQFVPPGFHLEPVSERELKPLKVHATPFVEPPHNPYLDGPVPEYGADVHQAIPETITDSPLELSPECPRGDEF